MGEQKSENGRFLGLLPMRFVPRQSSLWRVMHMLLPFKKQLISGNLLLIAASTLAGFTLVSLAPLIQFCIEPDTSIFTRLAQRAQSAEQAALVSSDSPDESTAPGGEESVGVVMEEFPVLRRASERAQDAVGKALAWATAGPTHRRFILVYSGVIIVLLLIQGLIQFLGQYTISRVGVAVSSNLLRKAYSNILEQEMLFFDRNPTGKLLKTSFQEIFQMRELVKLLGSTRPILPIRMLIMFGWLMVISVKLSILLLVLLPVVILPTLLLTRRLKKSWETEIQGEAGPLVIMTEVYQGIRAVKAFGAERLETQYMEPTVREFVRMTQKRRMAEAIIGPVVDMLNTFVLFAVFISAYMILPAGWNEQPSRVLVFMLMTTRFYKPFRALMTMSVRMTRARLVANRVFAFIDRKSEIADAANAVEFPTDWNEVLFNNLYLTYTIHPKGKKRRRHGVRGVDLTVRRGESVALIGPNGSGKSTLANLICRLYDPTQGEIRFGSVPLRRIRLESLRQKVCLITQRPILFNRSVADNIAFGLEGVTREQIVAAAKATQAHEFVTRLPDGYDTEVGEQGKYLSGGEQQRVALARAFVRNPEVLVFDEPTTGLDPEAREELLRLVLTMRERGITIFYVTHFLEEVRLFDRVLRVTKEHRVTELPPEDVAAAAAGRLAVEAV